MLIDIAREDDVLVLSLCGVKLKFTRGPKFEQRDGGPYGMYDIIKQYADVPFLPASIVCQHGWTPSSAPAKTDMRISKVLELCWNARFKEAWETESTVKCLIIGAPFVHYRRMMNIVPAEDARGTLAYPAHAMHAVKPTFDLDEYCDMLKALPAEFHPVHISLHPVDITTHGLDKEYARRGFHVVSAGLDATTPFYQRFYDLLRHYKYTTSNEVGSYIFYSVEMNIPFFILGQLPYTDNTSGLICDLPKKEATVFDYEMGKIAYELFSQGPRGSITPEQMDFVLAETGMKACATPKELRQAILRVAAEESGPSDNMSLLLAAVRKCFRYPHLSAYILRHYRFQREARKSL